jgi:hypothetical protein
MNSDTLMKRNDDTGYIVAWRFCYEHKAGKLRDEIMTYGQAKQKAAALQASQPDKVFWAEKLQEPFTPH